MKKLLFITVLCVLVHSNVCAQTNTLNEKEVAEYVSFINQNKSQFVKISLVDMHSCGIAVAGYFFDGKLVYINANADDNNELEWVKQELYLYNDTIVRIDCKILTAELAQYEQQYFADTSYIITFANSITFRKWGKEEKIHKKKITPSVQKFIDELLTCGQYMKRDLYAVVQQVDSLRFVKEMPYIGEYGINGNLSACGDVLFWKVVMLRDNAIEALIDKLDDTTQTAAIVPNLGYHYTIADIAFSALSEIIHNIPTFELLGVSFDKDGCGYCAYWHYVNEGFKNRQKFKAAVRTWYHSNQYTMEWVESNDFETCDCSRGGKHPNGGHFEVQ